MSHCRHQVGQGLFGVRKQSKAKDDNLIVTTFTSALIQTDWMVRPYRQEQQLEGDNISLLGEASSNLSELAPSLKGLLDALLDIAVDLMPEGRLQKQLPATCKLQSQCKQKLSTGLLPVIADLLYVML